MKRTTFYRGHSYSQGYELQYDTVGDGSSYVSSIHLYEDTNYKRTSAQGGSQKYANDIFRLSQMTSITDSYQGKSYTENELVLLFSADSLLKANR